MFVKTISLLSVIGTFAIMSASVATADSHATDLSEFNKKELNGRSSYISVAFASSELADIQFEEGEGVDPTTQNGMTAGFSDPDGIMVSLGNDFGYVRLETEFAHREGDVNSLTGRTARTGVAGDIDIGTAFMNLAFEYSIDPGAELDGTGKSSGFSVTPYITAGGGVLGVYGDLDFKRISDLEPDGVNHEFFLAPAIQGGAGLTIGLPMGAELFAQYSEMLAYTYNYRDSNDIHIKTVSGGLRLNF